MINDKLSEFETGHHRQKILSFDFGRGKIAEIPTIVFIVLMYHGPLSSGVFLKQDHCPETDIFPVIGQASSRSYHGGANFSSERRHVGIRVS